MAPAELDATHMARALELAARGEGYVEPNPMVGCVVARGAAVVGEGWHQRFGGPHAEVAAIGAAGPAAGNATLYVTLEPCCHHGKTPPCTEAIIDAGLKRVVIAMQDPFPPVDGGGIAQLRHAGIEVDVGVLEDRARYLGAPYCKFVTIARPWVLAKWAMTMDGKIATTAGESRWISSEAARAVVHELRGRVDAVMVGRRTAQLDNPCLTARPPGPRVAVRIVVDSEASLSPASQLVRTVDQAPLLVAVAEHAEADRCRRLLEAGAEICRCPGATRAERLNALLAELGRRRMTNVLVEGGATLLGSLADAGQIDELHVFVGPKLFGGQNSPSPVAGVGIDRMAAAWQLDQPKVRLLAGDVYLVARIRR